LKLTRKHPKEKEIRYNEICPEDVVMDCIRKRYGDENGGVRLCIDKCSRCPFRVHGFFDPSSSKSWHCIKAKDHSQMSKTLNQYLSFHVTEPTKGKKNGAVKYPDLQLEIAIFNYDTGMTDVKKQEFGVKVMKEQYFSKLRTPNPKKVAQPLNLTYPRFWIEICKDEIYLAILDSEALKKSEEGNNGKWPIFSSVGAYVDGSMEMQLAIMASFKDTEVLFEWYIHQDFIHSFCHGSEPIVEMRLKGNEEMSDWIWSNVITTHFDNFVMPTKSEQLKCGVFSCSNSSIDTELGPFQHPQVDQFSYGFAFDTGEVIGCNTIPLTPTLVSSSVSVETSLEVDEALSNVGECLGKKRPLESTEECNQWDIVDTFF